MNVTNRRWRDCGSAHIIFTLKPADTPDYCPLKEIDNEKHFLLKCTFHSVERRSLFKVINSLLEKEKESSFLYPDLINGQFVALMKTKDPIVLGALGKYIYEGFKKRDHLENNS